MTNMLFSPHGAHAVGVARHTMRLAETLVIAVSSVSCVHSRAPRAAGCVHNTAHAAGAVTINKGARRKHTRETIVFDEVRGVL